MAFRKLKYSLLGGLCAISILAGLPHAQGEVRIRETTYEGRPQYVIETKQATYFFDRAGGGFSRLIDREGNDWIAFRRDPLKEFPASAAAGYRGIPNLVFGADNPDAGAGHPGFDQCSSQVEGTDQIVTQTHSGKWQWRWKFTDDYATLTLIKADENHPYWFLYEGPVGGKWSPRTHYFGTDTGGPRRDVSDGQKKIFEQWRWAYFGDSAQPRALLVAHRNADQLDDTLWYLGNTRDGIESGDGMIVFGFGRGDGTKPLLRGADQAFRLGFVEWSSDIPTQPPHDAIAESAQNWIKNWNE